MTNCYLIDYNLYNVEFDEIKIERKKMSDKNLIQNLKQNRRKKTLMKDRKLLETLLPQVIQAGSWRAFLMILRIAKNTRMLFAIYFYLKDSRRKSLP